MKAQCPLLIENLGNLLLDAHKLKEASSSHHITMENVADRLIDKLTLLQEVIKTKTNISISQGILKIGKEPMFHWKQYLEFIVERSTIFANELKDMHDLV